MQSYMRGSADYFFVCDYETDAKCPQMDQQTSKSADFNGFWLYLLTKLSFRALGT